MGRAVAGDETNVLRWVRPRMVVLEIDSPTNPEPKKGDAEEHDGPQPYKGPDRYLQGMHVAFLKNAYVLMIPFDSDPKKAMYCRTDNRGNILRCEDKSAVGSIPGNEPKNWAPFVPDSRYYCAWSTSRAVFETIIKDVESNPSKALKIHPFF